MSSSADRQAKIKAAAGKERGGANPFLVAAIVSLLAIALIVGGVIWASTRESGDGGSTPGGIADGQPYNPFPDAQLVEGAPVVDVYEDFRCPVCKTFEEAFGGTIEDLAKEGKIKLQVHLKTVIDSNLGGDNSAVAASNALCAAQEGKWSEYHDGLFANQPEEPNTFSEETFTKLATDAGLEGAALDRWKACSSDEKYVDYVRSVDDESVRNGIKGTPALSVDGTKVAWNTFADASGQPDPAALEKVLTSGDVPADKVAKE